LLIDAIQSQLLLIDVQTKLAPAIEGADDCVNGCTMLLAAARILSVPVSATEHCPTKVGPTIPILRDQLDPSEITDKRHFNGALEPKLRHRLTSFDRQVVVIAGMEAHVCVLQTALGLKAIGFPPILVADAIASRKQASRELAIARSRHRGLDIVNVEMVMFEWLKVADSDAFAELLPMIKSGSAD